MEALGQSQAGGPRGSIETSRSHRRVGRAVAPLLACALSAGVLEARAFAQAEPEVVARLELAVPNQTIYLLRATLPVPPGTWDGEGPVPFAVRNPNGKLAPTQVETVTRHPTRHDGAAVVEVIARVRRPESMQTGERLRYDVVRSPHPEGGFELDEHVRNLVNSSGSVVLTTRDVFGNTYSADLLRDLRTTSSDLRVLREGELARQYGTHEVLKPVEPQEHGVYPHMMGVHAFVGEWSEERFLTLDLHVHNGLSGLSKSIPDDDAMQKLYFESLDLHVPQGWEVYSSLDDPLLGDLRHEGGGNVLSIVSEMSDGAMHLLPRQGHFTRRLVLAWVGGLQAGENMLKEKGLAFSVDGTSPSGKRLYSWWNAKTASYYPQNHRLPSLAYLDLDEVRSDLAAHYYHFASSIAQGIPPGYPVTSPALGYAHPWGIKYGGQTGGDEIVLYDGVEVVASGSNEGYRMAQLAMRLYLDRHRSALYNLNGRPTRDVDWLVDPQSGPSYIPIIFYGVPNLEETDPFGFENAPTFHDGEVIAQGRVPSYEEDLLGFQPIDLQHYIRYTRNLKTLAWLGNDALAKNEISMAGENARLSYHEYPSNPNGYVQGSGLLSALNYVEQYPGWGFGFGRGSGWCLDIALAAYTLGDDEVRERFYPWFEKVADLVSAGQSDCTGILQSTPTSKVADGQYRVMQSIEEWITNNMLWGMRSSVFLGVDLVREAELGDVIVESVRGQCGPSVWREEYGGPVSWVALGPYDMGLPPFCGEPLRNDAQADSADHSLCWSGFAYAYELTGDPFFLRRAKDATGEPNLQQFMFHSGLFNLGSRIALYALVQDLYQ